MKNKVDIVLLNQIKDTILTKNNLHWLRYLERVKYQLEEGRIPITNNDLVEIVGEYLKQSKQ